MRVLGVGLPMPSDPTRPAAGKRIAFIGAGAIGGYVGAHLARSGLDVTLIDQWPEHVDAIQRHGLRFSGTLGEYAIRVPALHLHEVQSLAKKPVDVAFICTKLYDTEWAAMLIRQYLSESGCVVTMQNSVVEERVAGIVGRERTLGCIASTLSAEAFAPGCIVRTRQPGGAAYTIFRAGEMHGRITPRLREVVAMLSLVDSAKATTNLWGERWSKLVANTMTTGICGASGLNLKSVLLGRDTRRLVVRLGAEAIRVGLALGYALEPVRRLPPETWLRADEGDARAGAAVDEAIAVELQRMTDDGYSGTAQDLRKGRRTEIDYMNGFVAASAREAGVPAPTHEAVTALIKRIERGEAAPDTAHVCVLLG
jgi:2-dehydropantoate 2-reductase